MKKFYSCFLTALLSMIAFTANAVNITINVDDPDRVEVQVNYEVQTLIAGDNSLVVEDYKPVTIKAKEGAFLTSVTKKSDNSSVYVYNKTASFYPGPNEEGETWTVVSITEEAMRDGSVSIWVDDASKVQVTRNGTNTDATLTNGENTVRYVTATELPLTIGPKSYSYELYKVELNDEEVEPQGTRWSISPNSGDKIKIYANFPDVDYKVDFSYTKEGTEGFITSVTVNGESIEDFSNGFTVKAGDKVAIYGNTSDYKFNSMSINGTPVSYFSGSYSFTVKEATTITLDVEKYATYKATINIDDPSHVLVYRGYAYNNNLISLSNQGDNTIEFNSSNPMIQIKPTSGCFITSISDGSDNTFTADYNGAYTVNLTENMTVTITTGAIERNQTANFYVDQPTGWTYFDVTRADRTSIKNDIVAGNNAINFYEGDNPFSLSWYNAIVNENNVFQNGVLKAPANPGSQSYSFTFADGDDVKVYLASEPTAHNVTFNISDDVASNVSISEKISAVAANWAAGLTVLDGTEVSLKAAEGTEIVVSVNETAVNADAEGNFTFTVTTDATVSVNAASATGISGIIADGVENGTVYNLNGTKVAGKATNKLAKGIYIINGRKYVVK